MAYQAIVEDNIDILVAGAYFGGTGAAFEARYWGQNKKIVIAEKANIDRSGAVAQGLYAINCYMGTRFGENNPEDHVRYARIDLMGMVREDLLFDMARHVDSAVHQFEEWGMPIMRDKEKGSFLREGRWQIMIHGESYKPLVAEAAKKSADKVYNRICVTHLLMDEAKENRVRRRCGLQRPHGQLPRFQVQDRDLRCGRRVQHLQAAFRRRRRGPCVVRSLVLRVGLRIDDQCRRQNDPDGKPDRAGPFQRRLRPGRRVLPAPQDLHPERLRRRVRIQVVPRPAENGRQGIP